MTSSAQEIIECWKAGEGIPGKYSEKMIKHFGKPDEYTPKKLVWRTFPGYNYPQPLPILIKVMDEYVLHDFPVDHYDYVYTMSHLPNGLNIEWEHAANLTYVTGSILIDTLKQTVIARCGGLRANQITLGFVYDYVRGDIDDITMEVTKENREKLKEEYAKRILGSIFSNSGEFANVFPDELTKGGGGRKKRKKRKLGKKRKKRRSSKK